MKVVKNHSKNGIHKSTKTSIKIIKIKDKK